MQWAEHGISWVLVNLFVFCLVWVDKTTEPVFNRLSLLEDSENLIFWGGSLTAAGYIGLRFFTEPGYVFFSFLALSMGFILLCAGFVCKMQIWADD